MKLYVKNTSAGLIPLYPEDLDVKKRLKKDTVYEVTIRQPRNYEFHKKFFALIKVGHENTSLEMPFDTYRKYCIMKAGYFNFYETPKGLLYEAESISFGNMSEDKFQEVYSRVIDVIIKDIGADQQTIENELINFL